MMVYAEPRRHAIARLAAAKRDVEQARTLAALVMDRIKSETDPYFPALECATVASYTQPFTASGESAGLPVTFCEFSDRHLQLAHNQLLQVRNGRTELTLGFFPLIHRLCSFQIDRLQERIDLDTEALAEEQAPALATE